MKKYLLILLVTVLPIGGFAQSLFDKYEELDDVTSVIVNQSMFNLLAKIDVQTDDQEAQEFMDIAKNIKSLRVFTTDNKSIGDDMKSSVNKYLGSSKLTELMRVKDKDANIKFYIKEGRDSDHVSELLMFMTGLNDIKVEGRELETVLLSLTGDIDLNKINSLTNKMNLPKELNKAGNKQ